MKSNKTLVLASLILALATAFCPHRASADTTSSTTASAARAGGDKLNYVKFVPTIIISIVSGVAL